MCGYFGILMVDWQLLYGDITPFPPGTKQVCQFIQAVREQHCAGRPCEALWPSFQGFHENYLWNRGTKLVASLLPGCQRALEQGVLQFAGLCGGTWSQTVSSPVRLHCVTIHRSERNQFPDLQGKLVPKSSTHSPRQRLEVISHVQSKNKTAFFHHNGNWNVGRCWGVRKVGHKSSRLGRLTCCASEWEGSLLWCPDWQQKLAFLPLFLTSTLSFGECVGLVLAAVAFVSRPLHFTSMSGWSLTYRESRLSQGKPLEDFW